MTLLGAEVVSTMTGRRYKEGDISIAPKTFVQKQNSSRLSTTKRRKKHAISLDRTSAFSEKISLDGACAGLDGRILESSHFAKFKSVATARRSLSFS